MGCQPPYPKKWVNNPLCNFNHVCFYILGTHLTPLLSVNFEVRRRIFFKIQLQVSHKEFVNIEEREKKRDANSTQCSQAVTRWRPRQTASTLRTNVAAFEHQSIHLMDSIATYFLLFSGVCFELKTCPEKPHLGRQLPYCISMALAFQGRLGILP